jgi:hypothetical protein
VVTPASVCHITTSRPMPGPSTGPMPGPVPGTKPSNLNPSRTGGRPVPWDGHSDRPLYRPSDGPKLEPSGGPNVGQSVILSPNVEPSVSNRSGISVQDLPRCGPAVRPSSCAVLMAPRTRSSQSATGNTCPLPDRRLYPRAEEWTPAIRLSQKEELRRLIALSTQQFNSSKSWSEFLGKCKDPRGDLHPEVLHLPHQATHLPNRL